MGHRHRPGGFGGQPGAEVAADQKRLQRLGRSPGLHHHLPDRGAHRDLVDAGPGHRAVHRDQGGAWRRRQPDRAEPVVPVPGDQRQVSQRLDVVDQGGPPVHAALVRPRGRERRLARAAVQVLHERGLLAGDVPSRDPGRPGPAPRRGGPRLRSATASSSVASTSTSCAVHAQVGLVGPDRVARPARSRPGPGAAHGSAAAGP